MTKAELRTEVFRRLNESAVTPVFWSATDVDGAVAEGYAEISDATEWYETWVDVDLLKDRPYYDLRTVLDPTFLALRPAFDPQTNRWLIPSTVRELDAHDRRWERVTGEPQRTVLRGLWWMGLWPRIQSEVGTIKQYYVALPPPLTNDTDEPGFPAAFHQGIVEFALTDLWAQDGETGLALRAWTQYLAMESALDAWVQGRASGPLVRGFQTAVTA